MRVKRFIFALVPVLALLTLLEVGLRCAYFQAKASSPLAIWTAIYMAREMAGETIYGPRVKVSGRRPHPHPGSWEALFSDDGQIVLAEFKAKYRTHFGELALACAGTETKLIVLYIPSTDPDSSKFISDAQSREFFESLAARWGIEYLDTSAALRAHPWDIVTLMPYDGHLSRFGNRIVADQLGMALANYPTLRRVLILGDSFAYGYGTPPRDSFPAILARLNGRLEVVNAGVCGYTIIDELQTLLETQPPPDIAVLQIDDNDIEGFFAFKLNLWAKDRKTYYPSENEKALLGRLDVLGGKEKE